MIFIINNLKYDTDKMELVSEKCKHNYNAETVFGTFRCVGKSVRLYRSKNDNWMLYYERDLSQYCGKAIDKTEAKALLLQYDLEKYEELFGELEEA